MIVVPARCIVQMLHKLTKKRQFHVSEADEVTKEHAKILLERTISIIFKSSDIFDPIGIVCWSIPLDLP